jgi:predicted metal-binding membrane protein
MLSSFPMASLSRRDRILIPACITLITLLSWFYLFHLGRQMSSEMEQDKMMTAMGMTTQVPWTAADVFFTFAMWVVMMVGMMVPAATPVILLFAGAQAKRGNRGARLATVFFGLGYVTVWAGFSGGAALAQWLLHQAAMLSVAMAASNSHLAGGVLVAAGVYQLTPWKGKCLSHCRSPLGFLMTNWRDGTFGAFQMGLHHGAYCLGCCWALMCVLFVVGVMNLFWVAILTGFVLLEKIGPQGAIIARVGGAALVVLGIVVIA